MVELTIPTEEASAIGILDADELRRLIDQSIRAESSTALHQLSLERCGPYISQALRRFERAVAAHDKAKSARKREQTGRDLWREGHGLSHAVDAMKGRLEEEREDAKLFVIDDRILPPYYFTENLSVTIHFRWRRGVEDEWTHGRIRFTHTVEFRPDYSAPKPKRKPSKLMLERERQQKLYHAWEQLMRDGLYTLRDYFRDDRDGAEIPESFEAVVDPYSHTLNNYSTDFWRKRSG
ncbi:hypothetical protein AWH62_03160 [Maricaulis sp. W15]|uniref:hypothetical protein n=1 Tax=Maricaulis sp. W15 TaxID=1772333 RepID=UPI000948E91F|nr:hypothetical protein [Maricaulis sp. W15]OLF77688.1 hypothetical protein AWH62_03160 [Maricaulis sp. W15]